MSERPVPKGLTPWKPGQSGNPGGRKRGFLRLLDEKYGHDARELFRRLDCFSRGYDPETETLMRSQVKDRILATVKLLEYQLGRPQQTLEVHGMGGPTMPVMVIVEKGQSLPPQLQAALTGNTTPETAVVDAVVEAEQEREP
jgi:hypothetical protein